MNKDTLYICTTVLADDRKCQKIILNKEQIWEACDLLDCPEDATLDRDLTNAEQILKIAELLRMSDYEVERVDFGSDSLKYGDFQGA